MGKPFSAKYIRYVGNNSPEWQARKAAYYARHLKRCRACGTGLRVELHHLTYVRLEEELDSDLMPLCRDHHRAVGTVRNCGFKLRTATWMVVLWVKTLAATSTAP